jgi:hypothetical protein
MTATSGAWASSFVSVSETDSYGDSVRYVALLRGINVGGKTLIKMADLKQCVEGLGFDDVSTYIASGSVLFESGKHDASGP